MQKIDINSGFQADISQQKNSTTGSRKGILNKSLPSIILAGVAFQILFSQQAIAQQNVNGMAQKNIDELEDIVVVGDPVGLLENSPTDSVFGLKRSILETPRSISVISAKTMERYSIEDIDDFVTTTPGTFGGSFFGVPGSISIRGSRADNYFRGFKRVVNNGFFPTPIGATEKVEIIRGPTPAIFGAGRIGGLLNFVPKTAGGGGMTSDDGPSGNVKLTVGSYDKTNISGELNLPFLLAGRETGVSVYAEYEDSKSYYINREPTHKLVQINLSHELNESVKVEFGGMYYDSSGYYQTPGWNRLTQDLIDNGNYITGRDTDLTDVDGNGRLTPNEVDAAVGTFFGTSNIRTLIDFGFFGVAPAYGLDEGVGVAKLDGRTVFLSENDEIEDSENITLYFDLVKEFENSELKFQVFYDKLDARIGLSTGFAAEHKVNTFEARVSYDFSVQINESSFVDFFATASHKVYNSELRENFLSGYLVLDRRDLIFGATGSDIFDTPFTQEPGGIGIGWDSNFDSQYKDTGVALVADIHLGDRLSVLLNGRYDDYSARSIDTGATVFDPSLSNTEFTSNEGDFSYSASVSYLFPVGFAPYFTYAQGANILENSNGGISPGTIRGGSILADSELIEAGVKFSLLDQRLNGSVAYYEQERAIIDPFGNVDGEDSKGVEIELRYIIDDHWTLTGAATFQEITVKAPGACFSGRGEFLNIPGSVVGLTPEQSFGGIFAALNASCLPELQEGYKRSSLPDELYSSFITYTSNQDAEVVYGGTFGGTYVSETSGKIDNAIVFPSYWNFRASAFVDIGRFNITATVSNIFDARYFTPLQGVFEEVAALPGVGREFRVSGKVKF
ncbi:MAG: TonB-dependent receptor [Alphaproteobacteria bacterium]|nr:MAG: TonB-dependent receptor [Alphaproteobacteria bacterium]